MGKDERTKPGLVLALVVLMLLGAGYALPWWSYEESSGRLNPPGGPQGQDTAVQRADLDFFADRWQGDIGPADSEAANDAMILIRLLSYIAAGMMLLYILGQVPGLSRRINRFWCMGFAGASTLAIGGALAVGAIMLPQSMAPLGVDGPFSAFLLEDGYIRSHLNIGWVAALFAVVASLSAGLAAYSAGDADPTVIEEYAVA